MEAAVAGSEAAVCVCVLCVRRGEAEVNGERISIDARGFDSVQKTRRVSLKIRRSEQGIVR